MKRKFVILLVVVLMLGLVVAPAGAGRRAPTGDRINVLAGTPTTYPADTAFYVYHGFLFDQKAAPVDTPQGRYVFVLTVDDVVQKGYRFGANTAPGETLFFTWLFNFPDGLSEGTHTFVASYYGPCIDTVGDPADCAKPHAVIEWFSETLDVEFTT